MRGEAAEARAASDLSSLSSRLKPRQCSSSELTEPSGRIMCELTLLDILQNSCLTDKRVEVDSLHPGVDQDLLVEAVGTSAHAQRPPIARDPVSLLEVREPRYLGQLLLHRGHR